MKVIDAVVDKPGALQEVSLRTLYLEKSKKCKSAFLCQTLNGKAKEFNDCVLDNDLEVIIEFIENEHHDFGFELVWNLKDINKEVNRLFLLTLPIIETGKVNSFDYVKLKKLREAKELKVMAVKSNNYLLFVIDIKVS
jgi:hypothetical protein